MVGPFGEQIVFSEALSTKSFGKTSPLFFIDKNLKNHKALKSITKQEAVIFLKAGEELKSLDSLQTVLKQVQDKTKKLKPPFTFVAIGGGSVGDFCGFLASIYHRGVDLIQCPSTWLAVIDSAHGGKTALNFEQVKNQIGSFHPAKKIIICKVLIKDLDPNTALGEILKTILLSPAKSKLREVLLSPQKIQTEWLWKNLKAFISIKNKTVKKDPYEKKGERFKLNLGHTVGHVIENLEHRSHSESVTWGLLFSLQWSYRKKLISQKFVKQIYDFLNEQSFDFTQHPKLPSLKVEPALIKDKKRKAQSLQFVFCKSQTVVIQTVKPQEVLTQLNHMGWIKP